MSSAEQRLARLGIELPPAAMPSGTYLQVKRDGRYLQLAGHGPIHPGTGVLVTGKVGGEVSLARAREAARLTGLQLLATIRGELGSLDRVSSVLRLFGMVNIAPGFTQTPAVIDGCSELLIDVFGRAVGGHVRSAVGMAELPFGMAVEIEGLVTVAE